MTPISPISSLRWLATLLFTFWVPLANAMLPGTMSYQAYVTDNTGAPVNGEQLVTFRLYTTETSASMIWQEVQRLTVQQGLLNAQLGAVTPLHLPDDFDTPLFLGIEMGTDGEMAPRQPLTLSGYAVQAANADMLDGQDAAALDQSAHVVDTNNPHQVSAAQVGAATPADIGDHTVAADAHHARYTNAEAVAAVQSHDGTGVNADTLDGSDSTAFAPNAHVHNVIYYTQTQVDSLLSSRDTAIDTLQSRIALLEEKLAKVTVSPDGNQIYVTAANLHLHSGSGATDGAVNGLGNLIVGYDEARTTGTSCSLGAYSNQTDCATNGGTWAVSHKSGSHNVVVGYEHNYSRFGGLVIGQRNTITGEFASVSGGVNNIASGIWSSVSGGGANIASFDSTSVSGGYSNIASAYAASVSGGDDNTASGPISSVSGGVANQATGNNAAVSGGQANTASGIRSSVSGGGGNIASVNSASVSGGSNNTAADEFASVSGGQGNSASGEHASVSGGRRNTARGPNSSVSGGDSNTASGIEASVSGGASNEASGTTASVSGGKKNIASGENASVSGGDTNVASSTESTVSGGAENQAIANNATVGGGARRSATGQNDWVAGALLQSD